MRHKKEKFSLSTDRDYAWKYFNLHAEQRLKTFHFYIIIITLLFGAIFTLAKIKLNSYILPMGGLITFFSFIFWKLDERNKELIHNAESCLKKLEKKSQIKLFNNDENQTSIKRNMTQNFFIKHFTFSESFQFVFFTLGLGGIILIMYELLQFKIDYEIFNKTGIINILIGWKSLIHIEIFIFLLILIYLFFSGNKIGEKFTKKNLLMALVVSLLAALFYIAIKLSV